MKGVSIAWVTCLCTILGAIGMGSCADDATHCEGAHCRAPHAPTDASNRLDGGTQEAGDGTDSGADASHIDPDTSDPSDTTNPTDECALAEWVPLYDPTVEREPDLQIETEDALITYLADRARDRHAREDLVNGVPFRRYDHYLPFYWEQRVADIEIIDHVAKGGSEITFQFVTLAKLNPAEFRTFYGNTPSVALYHNNMSDLANQGVELVSETPSTKHPGETEFLYRATLNRFFPDSRPLAIGDRIEIELSQFLLMPRNGRANYYGTAILYVVGQGVVPWYAKAREEAQSAGDRQNASFDSYPLPERAWLGGSTTLPYPYSNEPQHRFKQMAGNISPQSGHAFMQGRRLHHTDFSDGSHSEDGNPVFEAQKEKAGPISVQTSCVSCHINNGRDMPPAVGETLLRAVVKTADDAEGTPHSVLGDTLQPVSENSEGTALLASYEETEGTYGDGTPFTLRKPVYAFDGLTPPFYSVRLAPPLVGLGLLEAVDEATVAIRADPCDEDGDEISGRYRIVERPESPDVPVMGRFGYKAGESSLIHQIATALNRDMGVTTNLRPILDGQTMDDSTTPELSDGDLEEMRRYVSVLGVPARRGLTDAQVQRGETLFQEAACHTCHAMTLQTGNSHPYAELRNQTLHPFTDLLLHDMGDGLADTMGEPGVPAREWRTAPLWGIGLTAGVTGGEAYLHDGRAPDLASAILWHGGEAQAAREAFREMSAEDREALLAFLRSL